MPVDNQAESRAEQIWANSYPKHVRRNIEIPSISVYDIFKETSKKKFNSTGIDFLGKKYTYGELVKIIDNVASFLDLNGVKKGVRVALMVPNSPIYAINFFAMARLGGVIVQLNPLYTTKEIVDEIRDAQVQFIITTPEFYSKLTGIDANILSKIFIYRIEDFLPSIKGILYPMTATRRHVPAEIKTDNRISTFNPKKDYGKVPEIPSLDLENDVFLIQYTGGTTGIPKGALLTHKNLVSNAYQLKEWVPAEILERGSYLAAIPFFHVYGMMTALLLPVLIGRMIIMVPDPRDLGVVIKALDRGTDITFPGIPTMYHAILHSGKLKVSKAGNLAMLLSGAAPLPMELEKEFTSMTHGTIIEGYGLTESSPVVSATPISSSARRPGTVGFPLPNTEIRFVDRDDRKTFLPDGSPGELVVRGPQVMKGYYNNPAETAIALNNGWLHSGDVGFMDEDGYIHIVDRIKDLIIAGGYNIYPREIEELILTMENVEEVAVIGVPDPHRGETVLAVIVPKVGSSVTEKEVKAFCKEKLAVYKVPKIVKFRTSLPKSIVGKVLKKELRDEYSTRD